MGGARPGEDALLGTSGYETPCAGRGEPRASVASAGMRDQGKVAGMEASVGRNQRFA